MKNETIKSQPLFRNQTLEKLTHTNSKVAIGIYVLMSLTALVYGIYATAITFWQAFLLFNLGRLTFTLVEYVLHRYVYHSGEYDKPISWQFKVHGVHHKHPNVKDQLAMPIPIALVILILFFILFTFMMGQISLFFFSGFVIGYSFYLTMHYLIHVRKAPKNYFRWFWRHHHLHHRFDDIAFGLSSRIWDRVFRTMPPKRLKEA
ncbi:MAG: 4-hydroxysphinganine ceramide fatty acyl 2-hydroxylase [Bacteroidia bacterium]|jgi:4-hydroxysphinganine ceramide fatty acyl 2-hydroxylase